MRKLAKKMTAAAAAAVMLLSAFPAPAMAASASDYAPAVTRDSDGSWYYYINGEIDTSYTGLATNSNGTWYVKKGFVGNKNAGTGFDYEYTSKGGSGSGGWYISGSKVGKGSKCTVTESNGSELLDDNAYSGRLVIGDSRMEQLYEYNSYANYSEASFVAVWGGHYYGGTASTNINSSDHLTAMKNYIKESLTYLGYCDVYLETTVNDYNGAGQSYAEAAANDVISLASTLAGVSGTFCGETVTPDVYVMSLIGGNGKDVSDYNTYLKKNLPSGCTWMDISGCLDGYTSDGLHYNTATLKSLWSKILSCSHSYKEYTTAATCGSSGHTVKICSKCGNATSLTETDATGNHTWGSGKVTKEATATEDGVMTYTCSVCGKTKTEAIAATGCSHEKAVSVVTEAGCTTGGCTTYTCPDCGEVWTEDETKALGHSYTSKETSATCTKAGGVTYTCTRCGDSYTEEGAAALGHSYVSEETEATCTEAGTVTYTCTRCGDSYTEEGAAALGHSCSKTSVTDPGCTEEGYSTYTCSRCGYSYNSDYTKTLGHSWDSGTVISEPTDSCTGLVRYACTRCGATDDAVTDARGHEYEETVTEPTCTEEGYTTYYCSRCGDSFTSDNTLPLGHDFANTVIEPTCLLEGYTSHDCQRCGYGYTDTYTAALGHSYGEPSWETDDAGAVYAVFECSRCGRTRKAEASVESEILEDPSCCEEGDLFLTAVVVLPEGSDSFEGASEDKEAGTATYSCEWEEPIETLEHSWDEGVVTLEPTEEELGEMTYTCLECGKTMTVAIDALEHEWEQEEVSPTCTRAGYTVYTCLTCGEEYEDGYTDPLGHEYKGTITEPTCTEEGYTEFVCLRCGDTFIDDYVPAAGHSYEAVEGDDGSTAYVCSACGAVFEEEDPGETREGSEEAEAGTGTGAGNGSGNSGSLSGTESPAQEGSSGKASSGGVATGEGRGAGAAAVLCAACAAALAGRLRGRARPEEG